jgi:hypothetical protein
MPGPASPDPRLYCTRTRKASWITWRWYRFGDQPELNQVFASIPMEAERRDARCFMQQRVERLHRLQNQGQGQAPTRWFDFPFGGEAALPKEKVSLDPSLLVTPPAGLEVGFVPVPVYQRPREKRKDCEVVLGEAKEESEPLPANYYEGGGLKRSAG